MGPYGAAEATMTAESVRTAAKVTTFLVPPPHGPLVAAIVYDPADPRSVEEAIRIERTLRGGTPVGSSRLAPRRVPVTTLADLEGATVAFLTDGVQPWYGAIRARARGILTVAGDRSCAASGHCIVAIPSTGSRHIYVNARAAGAAGLRFNTIFAILARTL